MTITEKLLAAILGGGALYLLLARRTPAQQPIPEQLFVPYKRVMGYADDMIRFGAEQGVDPALIAAVMTVESGGMADAVGGAGEIGLMQILPSTGAWIGRVTPEQLRAPATNIQIGAAYIRYCIDRKAGSVPAGIAGYNYGPDRVRVEDNRVIAPESVIRYVANVLSHVEQYTRLFRAG